MPIFTVTGLQDGTRLFVSSVIKGRHPNADRDQFTDVHGTEMERFHAYIVADNADKAERAAVESVAWPYDDPDEATFGRTVTTINPTGEIL